MKSLVVCLACAGCLCASAATVVGAGYNSFAPVPVAPGQVITVFVTGVGNVTQKVSASPPLTATLGGISSALVQGPSSLPAPILAVFPFKTCSPGGTQSTCGSTTGVTVQIPFEMHVPIPGTLGPALLLTSLELSDAGGNKAGVPLDPMFDAIHVLRSEDTPLVADMAQRPGDGIAMVTHADGTPVTAANPAKGGERLVMYAVGLGSTDPPVKTGSASPVPAAPARPAFSLHYDYRPNAPPSPGIIINTGDPPPLPVPDFVGLTPGFVGLYQINFVVQGSNAISACAPGAGIGASPFSYVRSSMTVTIVGTASFDGAGICVEPASP
jgi:uncharacterized protein (TIGR03437 family)